MTATVLLSLVGALIVLEVLWSHRQLARAIDETRRPSDVPLARYPSVTVVRPVRGRDVGAEENFAAALDTGYPGPVETLFLFDDESDPGLPVARQVVDAHRRAGLPGTARVLVVGHPPPGRTGKLNAMIVGARLASGELIAFGDSDTRPDRHVLRVLVETLIASNDAGSAFAPVVVPGPARTAGDLGYALLINSLYGPSVALAARDDGALPFIMGQLMVFKRSALAAIGGVGCAEGELVDDMYIGTCVARAGYKNLVTPHPLHIATGGMSLGQFARLYRRWLLFSRNGLPFSFTWPLWLRGIEFWLAFSAIVFAVGSGHLTATLLPAAAVVAFAASLLSLHQRFGGEPVPLRLRWVPIGLFLMTPAVALATVINRQVNWRGRDYSLGRQARLA